jgi:hypothetical protein
MTQLIENLCPKFSSIDKKSYINKVYDKCISYALENFEILKQNFENNPFPEDKYYKLNDQLDNIKNNQSKKKDKNLENELKVNKEIRKKYPISLNKNVKTIIHFIIGRFLWELYYIKPNDNSIYKNKSEIESFILNAIKNDWSKNCNITQLIIYSVNLFQPSKIISESYNLDKEIKEKYNDHLENISFAEFASEYITEFIKLLMILLSNRVWVEKSHNINIKILETVLLYIEISIPSECKTISKGLMNEMYQYDNIINIKKEKDNTEKKEKTIKKESDDEEKKEKSKKSPVEKPAKKSPVKKESDEEEKKEKSKKSPVEKPAKKSPVKKESDEEEKKEKSKKSPVEKPVDKPAKKSPVEKPVEKPSKKLPVKKESDEEEKKEKSKKYPVEKPAKKLPVKKESDNEEEDEEEEDEDEDEEADLNNYY